MISVKDLYHLGLGNLCPRVIKLGEGCATFSCKYWKELSNELINEVTDYGGWRRHPNASVL